MACQYFFLDLKIRRGSKGYILKFLISSFETARILCYYLNLWQPKEAIDLIKIQKLKSRNVKAGNRSCKQILEVKKSKKRRMEVELFSDRDLVRWYCNTVKKLWNRFIFVYKLNCKISHNFPFLQNFFFKIEKVVFKMKILMIRISSNIS